jgi:hypothetical protein
MKAKRSNRSEILEMVTEQATVPLWPDAGSALGLTRGSTYKAAREGEIVTLKFGKLLFVSTAWLRAKLGLDA